MPGTNQTAVVLIPMAQVQWSTSMIATVVVEHETAVCEPEEEI